MSRDITIVKGGHSFGLLYLSSFVLAFHLFFVVYINSSFLSTFIDEKFVGTVYIVSSFLSMLTLLFISKILRRFGNFKTLFALTILELVIFLGMALFTSAPLVLSLFVAYSVVFPLMLFNYDVFLEGYTEQKDEGSVRGTFLTIVNLALIMAPFASGLILDGGEDYGRNYLIAALFLIPFLFLIQVFRNFKDPVYHDINIKATLTCLRGNKNLNNILTAQFLLRFFFSWMVIYMPIYLHQYVGFDWTEIGIMTAIILLPYIIFELPAGKIADKYLGEKELLVAGFIVTGLATLLVSFIEGPDFLLWTIALFMGRAGASLIEIMTESYFFKHVDGSDNNTISFFRIMRPIAYMAGPLLGTIALFFIGIQYIWIILGLIVLTGVASALQLQDTR